MEIEIAAALLAAITNPFKNNLAYLDPGSGSILIQLLIAGLLGAGFILRSSWGKIKTFFRRDTPEETDKPEDEQ
jgi:hypothetical protein